MAAAVATVLRAVAAIMAGHGRSLSCYARSSSTVAQGIDCCGPAATGDAASAASAPATLAAAAGSSTNYYGPALASQDVGSAAPLPNSGQCGVIGWSVCLETLALRSCLGSNPTRGDTFTMV